MTKGLSVAVAALGSAVTISVVAGVSALAGQPLLAPPLGATALLCIVAPQAPASAPRNVVLAHVIALLCGWVALELSGAAGRPSALVGGFRPDHVLSAALAMGLTVALTERFHVRHPPSGATTLSVSLGVLQQPVQFAAVACGAALTAGCALVLHRLAGVRYPLWSPAEPAQGPAHDGRQGPPDAAAPRGRAPSTAPRPRERPDRAAQPAARPGLADPSRPLAESPALALQPMRPAAV